MGIVDSLRSAACFFLLPVNLIGQSAGALVHALAGGSPPDVHRWYLRVARGSLHLGATELSVQGLENLDENQSYVLVSNHESNWDPMVIMGGLPELAIRFVAKRQIMRIPIFGQALARSGNIRVDREHTGADVQRLQAGMSERREGVSILFFAEGTRSRDGSYHAFRKGAFAAALQYKLPILPIAVAGTRAIWAPGSAWIRRGPAVLEIGAPIPVEGVAYESRDALRDQAHEVVGKLRARARERLRSRGFEPGGID